jgi:hypothetical protein
MMAEVSDNLFDRALLLGAVFGDGYIQKRGEDSYKVVVTSGNQYPAWFDRIDLLFERVFGSRPHVYDKPCDGVSDEAKAARRADYRFCEKHLTVSGGDLVAAFGMLEKYAPGRGFGSSDPCFATVPAWVNENPEATRAFILGLVETDGSFSYAADARQRSSSKFARFFFVQKDRGLSMWMQSKLRSLGFICTVHWAAQATTWRVVVSEQSHVKRLGEWLGSSAKYAALLASGEGPRTQPISRRTGEPLKLKPARFFPALDMAWQLAWRELRATGMSLDKIAKAYGVSKGTVHVVTSDVVPASRMPPDEADRRLQAYFETHGKPAPRVWDLQKAKASKSPRSAA